MALDLRQNFVSPEYLENKLTEFHQKFICVFIFTRSTLGLSHIIFRTFVPELWHVIYANLKKFTKFYKILYMHGSMLGLLH